MSADDKKFDDFLRKQLKKEDAPMIRNSFTDNVMGEVDRIAVLEAYKTSRKRNWRRIFFPAIGVMVLWIALIFLMVEMGWLNAIHNQVISLSQELFDSQIILYGVVGFLIYQVVARLFFSYFFLVKKKFK